MDEETNPQATVGGILFLAGVFGVIGALALRGYQAYVWLRYGIEASITLQDACISIWKDTPHVDWVGVQMTIDQILTMPAWLALLGASIVTAIIGANVASKAA